MTGSQVLEIRTQLGMTAADLARLVGVHSVTVRRWELSAEKTCTAEGHARPILLVLRRHASPGLGAALVDACAAGGNLVALHLLLRTHFAANSPAAGRGAVT